MIKEIKEDELYKVIKSKKPVLVKLYTDSCTPCKMMSPMFHELSEEYTDVDFFQMNAELNNQIMYDHDVNSVPTLLYFKDGAFSEKVSGLVNKTRMQEMIW